MNKIAAMCLIASVEASQITETREPLLTWAPSAKKGHPVDYFVPNFGNDSDMAVQQNSVAKSEAALKHVFTPKRDADDEKWVVPSADAEFKLLQAFADMETEENREPLLTWSPTAKKSGFKKDYFIPNFGEDRDIGFTRQHLSDTETKLNHKWNWAKAGKDHKKDYAVPNFGRDADINDSISNLKSMEAQHGTWDLPKDDWF